MKDIRLTEEQQDIQIEANKQNIESQITLTDINTTDIAELKVKVDNIIIEEGDIPIGLGEDLLTNDRSSIVAAINEVQTETNANTTKNEQQDVAINLLANNIVSTSNAYSEVTTLGLVSSTNSFVKNVTIVEPSTDTNILSITELIGYTEFYVKSVGRIDFIYKFNAIESVGTTPELIVELIDTETNTVIKTDSVIIDFAGSANVSSGINTLSASVNNQKLALRVRTKVAGNSVDITYANIKIDVTGAKQIVDGTIDTNVLSTNNLGLSENVYGDIKYLNDNKANKSDLDALEVIVDAIEVPDTTDLENRVSANEDAILSTTAIAEGNTAAIEILTEEDTAINSKLDEIYEQIAED